MATLTASPPKDNLFRALPPADVTATGKTLTGHFAVFSEWAEINSAYEGRFMERFAAGSFSKTFRENRQRMRCIFRHGLDPELGDKPIGKILELAEDETGALYEVELFDGLPPLVMSGLRAGEYGTSFRFGVVKEDFVLRPKRAAHNPEGLPERTVTEAYVREFGPCTFATYLGTTASIRSATDDFIREHDEEEGRGTSTAFFRDEAKPAAEVRDVRDVETEEQREERHTRLYARTLERIGATIWELHPDMLSTIVSIVAERASGVKLSDDEIRQRIGVREDAGDPPTSPVAVLQLRGPIVPHAGMVDATSSELASVEQLRGQFRAALNDPEVSAILFEMDSPGGDASLIPEFAAEIYAARGEKPIVAIANTWAASAAYHLAVSADEIVVTPSGEVGSIGAWTAHDDLSGALEQKGVKTTMVKAGRFKAERNPYEPLGDEAKAYMQEQINEVYGMFVKAVAKGRGVSESEVRSGFGEGRMVRAASAVELGMADRIATFDETLARLTKSAGGTKARVSQSAEPEPSAATTPNKSTPEPSGATTRTLARPKRATPTLRTGKDPRWRL